MLSMSRGTAAHGDSLMRTRSVRLAAEAERGAEGGATAVRGGEEVAVQGRGLMGGGAVARIAVHVPSAYLSGYHRQRPKGGSAAERPVALPPEYRKGERHMPQSSFLHLRDAAWMAAEAQQACVRAWCELMEIRAETWDAIATSRELMAEIDVALAAISVRLRQPRLPTDI